MPDTGAPQAGPAHLHRPHHHQVADLLQPPPAEVVLSLQRRLEESFSGRVLLSWFVVFTVLAIVGVDLPDSVLRDDLHRLTGRYVQAVGLDQNWAVFSQPRTLSAYVEAKVDFADGSSRTVPITASRGLGSLVDYRWQKYEEVIRPDGHRDLWLLYARYVARQARTEGRPVRVTLMRRFAESRPPGPGPARVPFQRYAYFTYDVPGPR